MVTYTQAIKYIRPVSGQKLHIFLMANDFYSFAYDGSNYRHYESSGASAPEKIEWIGHKGAFRSKVRRWINNSFTYQSLMFRLKQRYLKEEPEKLATLDLKSFKIAETWRIYQLLGPSKALSIVEHAFPSCFSGAARRTLRFFGC